MQWINFINPATFSSSKLTFINLGVGPSDDSNVPNFPFIITPKNTEAWQLRWLSGWLRMEKSRFQSPPGSKEIVFLNITCNDDGYIAMINIVLDREELQAQHWHYKISCYFKIKSKNLFMILKWNDQSQLIWILNDK